MVFFVPGGPGFSSKHEAEVLSSRLDALGWGSWFWDDPWRGERAGDNRSLDAYVDALQLHIEEHAGSPRLTIIGHSFAVHPLLIVLGRRQLSVNRLVLVSPMLDLHEGHRRLVQLAARDFEETQRARAARLRELLEETRALFDVPMRAALMLAAEDPLLLQHYWYDKHAFGEFVASTEGGDSAFSAETFFGVLEGLARRGLSHLSVRGPFQIPTTVVFGAADPVVDRQATAANARLLFTSFEEHCVDRCGHWLHLERPDEFLEIVLKTSKAK